MDDEYNSIAKGRDDADQKVSIIPLAHAIIKPHAVMIEVIDASIASAAVLTITIAVAIAVFAEQYFLVIWRKYYLFIKSRPFIIIDYSIGWVLDCRYGTGYYHERSKDDVESH